MRNNRILVVIALLSVLLTSCIFEQDVHQAALDGNSERIRSYIESGGKVDSLINNKYSLLGYAALGGHVELMQYLIAKGANEKKRSYGKALIHDAARSKNIDAVKFLLERGADVNCRTISDRLLGDGGQTPLLLASQELDYPMAAYLIRKGAHVNDQDEYNNSPLITAIFLSDVIPTNPAQIFKFVKLLVENGADVNLADRKGSTPLALAALTENKELIDYLVKGPILTRGEKTAKPHFRMRLETPIKPFVNTL